MTRTPSLRIPPTPDSGPNPHFLEKRVSGPTIYLISFFLARNSPKAGPKRSIVEPRAISGGCSFFAYSWKLPAYSGASLLTIDNLSFFSTHNWSFSAYSFSFFAYSGKVHLMKGLKGP